MAAWLQQPLSTPVWVCRTEALLCWQLRQSVLGGRADAADKLCWPCGWEHVRLWSQHRLCSPVRASPSQQICTDYDPHCALTSACFSGCQNVRRPARAVGWALLQPPDSITPRTVPRGHWSPPQPRPLRRHASYKSSPSPSRPSGKLKQQGGSKGICDSNALGTIGLPVWGMGAAVHLHLQLYVPDPRAAGYGYAMVVLVAQTLVCFVALCPHCAERLDFQGTNDVCEHPGAW